LRFVRSDHRILRCARSTIRFPPTEDPKHPATLAQPLGDLSIHLFCAALPQPLAVRFRQPACGIHQCRAGADQCRSGANHRQMNLRLALRCRTGPSKPGSIRASAPASGHRIDRPFDCFRRSVARSAHEPRSLVAQLAQLPADPRECVPVSSAIRLRGPC